MVLQCRLFFCSESVCCLYPMNHRITPKTKATIDHAIQFLLLAALSYSTCFSIVAYLAYATPISPLLFTGWLLYSLKYSAGIWEASAGVNVFRAAMVVFLFVAITDEASYIDLGRSTSRHVPALRDRYRFPN